jgi:hypothetical protein
LPNLLIFAGEKPSEEPACGLFKLFVYIGVDARYPVCPKSFQLANFSGIIDVI